MPGLTTDQILEILRQGTPERRARLLAGLPDSPLKAAAAALVESDHPGTVIIALTALVQDYCYGSEPAVGAALADALHQRARDLWDKVPDHGLSPASLAGIATSHLKALSLLGESDALLAAASDYVDFYRSIGAPEEIPAIRILRAEALLNLQRVDDAASELEDPAVFENPVTRIEAERLRGWVDRYRTGAASLKADLAAAPEGASAEAVRGAMAHLFGLAGIKPPATKDGGGTADTAADAPPGPPEPERFRRLLGMLDQGESILTRGREDTALGVRGRIRNASAIFVHGTPPAEVIRRSLNELGECLLWARDHRVIELENDALWGIYLCNSRLLRAGAAADALIELRNNLEGLRAGIADPLRRAGTFSAYPHLFNVLCEKLQIADRPAELLEAIESSKGRVIADRLTSQEGRPVRDGAIYGTVRRLPEIVRRAGCHYLTYFVDDLQVQAAFVSADGAVHGLAPIPIGREALQKAASQVRPDADDWRASADLAPLVAWLGDFLDRGIVSEGDHIAYSSDEDFHNVPLQYLPFGDRILVDVFSVSRVHSAFHLERVTSGPAAAAPGEYLGVIVPTRQDLRRGRKGAFVESLTAPVAWLVEHGVEGETLVMEEATVDALERRPLDHRIIHFSAHGHFPALGEGSPYEDSWLVLADSSGIPDSTRLASLDRDGRLSPARVLGGGLDLTGSHVSMMACVSGLAREGAGGDSLGLDWALIQCGAQSLISTHWPVSASAAARFFACFYGLWVAERLPRREAFRRTLLKLMGDDRSPWTLSQWAAFSLTGDFR